MIPSTPDSEIRKLSMRRNGVNALTSHLAETSDLYFNNWGSNCSSDVPWYVMPVVVPSVHSVGSDSTKHVDSAPSPISVMCSKRIGT
jgi:hypothetical protein